jgi:hypothetical protein
MVEFKSGDLLSDDVQALVNTVNCALVASTRARRPISLWIKSRPPAGSSVAICPRVLDIETDGGLAAAAVQSAIDTWIARVEQRTRRRPIIYTGSYFWDDNVLTSKYAAYPLWTAHYTSDPCPLVADAWSDWSFWQYADSDSVAGVTGGVDGDLFNGTLAELKAFAAASVIGQPDAGPHDKDASTGDGGWNPWSEGGAGADRCGCQSPTSRKWRIFVKECQAAGGRWLPDTRRCS